LRASSLVNIFSVVVQQRLREDTESVRPLRRLLDLTTHRIGRETAATTHSKQTESNESNEKSAREPETAPMFGESKQQ
jgi:hypothetical protein